MNNPMKFFWGLVFTGIGVLLLGTNLGWWSAEVWNMFWLFWPMIFIVLGIRFLVNDDLIFSVVALILVLGTGYLIINQPPVVKSILGGKNIQTENVSGGEVMSDSKLSMKVNLGAANIHFGSLSEDSKKLYALVAKNLGKIQTQESTTNGVSSVTISEDFQPTNFNSKINKREMSLNLTQNVLTDLTLDSGASNLDLDFSKLKLESFNLNSGASNGEIKFGDLVDLLNASVDTGASKMTFLVPKNVGLRVDLDQAALNSKNFSAELNLESNGNIYQTKDYDNASKKISLKISAGVSNFEIKQY